MKKIVVYPSPQLTKDQKEALIHDIPGKFIFAQPTDTILQDADIIIGNPSPEELTWCKQLSWLQLVSAGSDQYRELPATIALTNASGTYGVAIGEHLLTVTLMMMKKMPQYADNQRKHIWKNAGQVDAIIGSTFVILGMGDLGSEYASRIHALGGYTIGVRRHQSPACPPWDEVYTIDQLHHLLPRADVLVMCLPNHEETQQLMNKETFSLMKQDAYFINVGRGSAVDETAFYHALQNKLQAAAMDVSAIEPLPQDSPLWDCDNLIITPHISGNWNLPSNVDCFIDIAHRNLVAYFHDQSLDNEVDRKFGY